MRCGSLPLKAAASAFGAPPARRRCVAASSAAVPLSHCAAGRIGALRSMDSACTKLNHTERCLPTGWADGADRRLRVSV